jgi:hypothetical protein
VNTEEGSGCFFEGDITVLAGETEKDHEKQRSEILDSRKQVYRGVTISKTIRCVANEGVTYYLRWRSTLYVVCTTAVSEVLSV